MGFGSWIWLFFFSRGVWCVRGLDDLRFYYTITMFTVLTEVGFISGGLVSYTFGSIPPPKIPGFYGYNSSLVWVC